MHSRNRFNIVLLATCIALAPPASNAQTDGAGPAYSKGCSATAQVLNANDSGSGSLRAAIDNVCPNGTITFGDRFVIALQSEIVISKALSIDGRSQSLDAATDDNNLVQILGGTTHRIFRVEAAGDITLKRLRLSNGAVPNTGGGILNGGRLTLIESRLDGNVALSGNLGGGAIFNEVGAVLRVESTSFTGNDATRGSAIFNGGTVELINSTFSENRGRTTEGAIQNRGILTGIHITVANNGRLDDTPTAGGLFAFGTTTRTTLINSIIADNGGRDCFISGGTMDAVALLAERHDNCAAQLTVDPALGALSANGGVTSTHAPAAGSPAVNAADAEFCVAKDQRGFIRTRPQACDLGAVELEGLEPLLSDGFETQ